MMKKLIFGLALLLGVIISLATVGGSTVQAQTPTTSTIESMDTILARAAAKSFLVTLTRPDLSATMKFYLLDSLDAESIVAEAGQVSGYTITSSEWLTPDKTYQVEARLQPGNRTILIQTGKHNYRWRVEKIELAAAATTGGASAVTTVATTGPAPVAGNGAGLLAFQTRNGGEIYVIKADGTELRQVTRGIDPQLSPDGSKIAFTRWENGYELYTVDVDGSNETVWFSNKVQMKSPTWSADGTRLIFSHQVFFKEGRFVKFYPATYIIRSLRAGEKVNVPRIPANAYDIKINDDGSVEYKVPPDGQWHLAQVNLSNNEYVDLTTGSSYNYAPNGHPSDPNTLIFRGDKGVSLYNTASQSGQAISFDGNDRGPVALSPDGTKLAVTYWQEGHWEIHTMSIDGSNRQRLTETPLSVLAAQSRSEMIVTEEGYKTLTSAQPDGQQNPHWNNAAPVWSPDGSKIAYVSDRSGKWKIWIMNADGSDQRPMFTNGALDQLDLNYAGVDERMISWR